LLKLKELIKEAEWTKENLWFIKVNMN